MNRFPETIAAAKVADGAQWKIGDALLREANQNYTGPRGLQAVSDELGRNGLEYASTTLSQFRTTAEAFPRNRRYSDLPWSVHSEAGNPDTLDVLVKVSSKEGIKLSSTSKGTVRQIIGRIRKEERAEREAAKANAEAERRQAEREEQEARTRALQAKNDAERESARRDREKARQRKHEARDRRDAARVAPKKQHLPTPKEQEVMPLLVKTRFSADIGEVKSIIRRASNDIKPVLDDLSPAFINSAVEELLSAANDLRALADLLRGGSSKRAQRGHLYAVND